MANFKRGYSKLRGRKGKPHTRSLQSWPRWWDVLHHRRPPRRITHALVKAVLEQRIDPDEVAWPVSSHKPHAYYW